MGCKCSAEEHLSEVASLNGQNDNINKHNDNEKDTNNMNPFQTPRKGTPINNDDTAATVKADRILINDCYVNRY